MSSPELIGRMSGRSDCGPMACSSRACPFRPDQAEPRFGTNALLGALAQIAVHEVTGAGSESDLACKLRWSFASSLMRIDRDRSATWSPDKLSAVAVPERFTEHPADRRVLVPMVRGCRASACVLDLCYFGDRREHGMPSLSHRWFSKPLHGSMQCSTKSAASGATIPASRSEAVRRGRSLSGGWRRPHLPARSVPCAVIIFL